MGRVIQFAEFQSKCADPSRKALLAKMTERYETLRAEYLKISNNITDMNQNAAELVGEGMMLHARLDEIVWMMQVVTLCSACPMKGEC